MRSIMEDDSLPDFRTWNASANYLKSLAFCCGAAMVVATVVPAHAQRPDTRAYSCGQVSALVQQQRAIVLSTGRYTYARYVAGQGYCGPTQNAVRVVVPTADLPNCPLYTCKERLWDR